MAESCSSAIMIFPFLYIFFFVVNNCLLFSTYLVFCVLIANYQRVSDSISEHLFFCFFFITYVPFSFYYSFSPWRPPSQRPPSLSSFLGWLTSRPVIWLILGAPSPCPGQDPMFPLSWFIPPGGSKRGSVEVDHFKLACLKYPCSIFTLDWWFDLSRILGWKPLSLRVLKALRLCLLGSNINGKNSDGHSDSRLLMSNLLFSHWKF